MNVLNDVSNLDMKGGVQLSNSKAKKMEQRYADSVKRREKLNKKKTQKRKAT
jgi:hypothetical protein